MIYVIRHGQTDWNKQGLIQSRADIPLNEAGREQAKEAKALLKDVTFSAVYASNLSRAIDTARIISSEKLINDERITEICSGKFEGMHISEVKLIKNSKDYSPESYGVETYEDVLKRVDSFFRDVLPTVSDSNILIVTHGGTCKAIRQWFNQFQDNKDDDISIPKNCEILVYNNPFTK